VGPAAAAAAAADTVEPENDKKQHKRQYITVVSVLGTTPANAANGLLLPAEKTLVFMLISIALFF
jgi:hypothetical protein